MGSDGDFIVYVDESGDHGLHKIDPEYPIFVLAFAIFRKEDYASQAVPEMLRFKFTHFGHDQVILHEHEIKKAKGAFRILIDSARRAHFMADLSNMMASAQFTLVAVVIKKTELKDRYSSPSNPYALAMEYGLERVCAFLEENDQADRRTHVIFERRGSKEDLELELEFRRVIGGANPMCSRIPLEIVMTDKKAISTGLQIADLVARPIGLHVLRPMQANRAWEIILPKLRRGKGGRVDGYGLKCFP
ncbi:MAG: DUF3800 domain-containing protein [Gemmatimonadaceae bacterium]|nr:DUF3800 domain-containing protein [Gemmatimonadaceae bacterium]